MYLKKIEILSLSCLVAVGAVCKASAANVQETFESHSEGAAVTALGTAWTGYGSVEANAVNYNKAAGRPLTGDSAKVLRVEGNVVCAPDSGVAGAAKVDMLVQAALPDEALTMPEGENTSDIQIAVGADKTEAADKGVFKVYCKDKANAVGWYTLKENIDKDAWYRVSFVFDYDKGTCQVRLDGEPVVTANGYLTSDPAKNAEANGSWYKLNFNPTEKKLSSIKVVGSTALDDLVVKNDSELAYSADAVATDSSNVPLKWLAENGLAFDAPATTVAPDGSGMKVAEKYETGLSPVDGEKFAFKTMTVSASGATFTIPEMNPPANKKVQLVYSSSSDFANAQTVDVANNATSVTLANLPDGVLYYHLQTADK